jgi:KDO2-lipid IV(A) lauroyltransferase
VLFVALLFFGDNGMSKQRSVSMDWLVYATIRLVVCVLQVLPFGAACGLAAAFAWVAYRADRRHRLVALDNLRHAFPGRYTEAELGRLVRAVYRHFCLMLIEIVHAPRLLRASTWRRHLRLDERRFSALLLSGRPLMFVAGHFGNWELGNVVFGLLGFPIHAIARPLDNRFADDFLRRYRERTGGKLLAKKGDFDQMQAILAGGGVLGTVADQDAGPRGLFVDFFGRPASTHKAVALLALEHGVPLVVLGGRRAVSPGRLPGTIRYEVVIEDVILPEEYAGHADAVRAMTQRFTAALERLIRTAPEQYFWLHRRWKHRPPVRKGRQAA